MIEAAVIGCGRMGAFTSESVRRFSPPCWLPLAHAEAMAAHPAVKLIALADSNPDNLERACGAYGVARGFTDFRVLAEAVRPALVGIATRTIGRSEIIETLHRNGTRAFHVEKPLCNTVMELAMLEHILGVDDVFVTLGAVRRHFQVYRTARDMVRSGRLGALLEVRVNFGPGALYWVHPHTIDLVLFAADGRTVRAVQARFAHVEQGSSPDEVVNDPVLQAATIWFADGVAGHITRAPGLDLVLSCERGEVAVLADGRGLMITEQRGGDPYLVREFVDAPAVVPPGEGTLAAVSQLVACLRGDPAAIAMNAAVKRDILVGQRIIFGFIQSHRDGSRLTSLNELGSGLSILARAGGSYA